MKTKKTVELRRYIAEFKTTDGEFHKFSRYRFANPKALLCTIPEYIMGNVKSDGYMTDDDGIMYPLSNIVSIKWVPIDEMATAHDNGRHSDRTAELVVSRCCTFAFSIWYAGHRRG